MAGKRNAGDAIAAGLGGFAQGFGTGVGLSNQTLNARQNRAYQQSLMDNQAAKQQFEAQRYQEEQRRLDSPLNDRQLGLVDTILNQQYPFLSVMPQYIETIRELGISDEVPINEQWEAFTKLPPNLQEGVLQAHNKIQMHNAQLRSRPKIRRELKPWMDAMEPLIKANTQAEALSARIGIEKDKGDIALEIARIQDAGRRYKARVEAERVERLTGPAVKAYELAVKEQGDLVKRRKDILVEITKRQGHTKDDMFKTPEALAEAAASLKALQEESASLYYKIQEMQRKQPGLKRMAVEEMEATRKRQIEARRKGQAKGSSGSSYPVPPSASSDLDDYLTREALKALGGMSSESGVQTPTQSQSSSGAHPLPTDTPVVE